VLGTFCGLSACVSVARTGQPTKATRFFACQNVPTRDLVTHCNAFITNRRGCMLLSKHLTAFSLSVPPRGACPIPRTQRSPRSARRDRARSCARTTSNRRRSRAEQKAVAPQEGCSARRRKLWPAIGFLKNRNRTREASIRHKVSCCARREVECGENHVTLGACPLCEIEN
jgi:hypothetical protein